MRTRHPSDILLTLAMITLLFWAHLATVPPPVAQSSVTIDGTTIVVDIARTPGEHERGLSGREQLIEKTGMLFLFDHPDRYGFWMPDMHFAIDIIWIDSSWRIVDIAHNVVPESYPQAFTPVLPAQYVLEVPAGAALRYGWQAGDKVEFNDQ